MSHKQAVPRPHYYARADVVKSVDFYVVSIKLTERDENGKLRPAPGSFTMDASFLWPVAQALRRAEAQLERSLREDAAVDVEGGLDE